MQDLKYIKYFKNYLAEQDMSTDDAGLPAAAPKSEDYYFLFLDEDQRGEYKYPDGSSTSAIQSYQISQADLNKWLDSNVTSHDKNELSDNAIKVKKDTLKEYIAGDKNQLSPEDKHYAHKFKNSVLSDQLAKKAGNVDVIFSKDKNEPTTDAFNTTFIILPVKND